MGRIKKKNTIEFTGTIPAIEWQVGLYIKTVVANFYSVPMQKVDSKTRKREIVKARQVAMYLMFENTKMGPGKVASFYDKDHATAIHAKRTIKGYLDWDRDLIDEVDKLQKIVEVKTKALLNRVDLENDYYYIDMSGFYSLRVAPEKAIILVGYTKDEIDALKQVNQLTCETRQHKDTGMYVLEKK